MKFSVATVTIEGISPLRYSKRHESPKLNGEAPDAYDQRTVMDKAHWSEDGETLLIPAPMMKAAIVGGAAYSGEKIKGKGQKTWTGKFKAGVAIMSDIATNVSRKDMRVVAVFCDSQGGKGVGGKSVLRRFPEAMEWSATFEVWVLDPEITGDKVRQMLELSGMFNGLGTWAPRVGGMNGRFVVTKFAWQDNREFVPSEMRATRLKLVEAA